MQKFLFLFVAFSLFSIEKISILIPCHPAHFALLEPLLTSYADQTMVPDEVVISLSESRQIASAEIGSLENRLWPFRLIVLQFERKQQAATNRKCALKASSGDLLLFQDADDLPHPQRVEIVKQIFEQQKVHLLIHSFAREGEIFVPIESVSLIPMNFDFLIQGIRQNADFIPLHHGNVCMSRLVAQTCQWKDVEGAGEDLQFNIQALSRFPRSCYVTPLPLIQFRQSLSYFSNTPSESR